MMGLVLGLAVLSESTPNDNIAMIQDNKDIKPHKKSEGHPQAGWNREALDPRSHIAWVDPSPSVFGAHSCKPLDVAGIMILFHDPPLELVDLIAGGPPNGMFELDHDTWVKVVTKKGTVRPGTDQGTKWLVEVVEEDLPLSADCLECAFETCQAISDLNCIEHDADIAGEMMGECMQSYEKTWTTCSGFPPLWDALLMTEPLSFPTETLQIIHDGLLKRGHTEAEIAAMVATAPGAGKSKHSKAPWWQGLLSGYMNATRQ